MQCCSIKFIATAEKVKGERADEDCRLPPAFDIRWKGSSPARARRRREEDGAKKVEWSREGWENSTSPRIESNRAIYRRSFKANRRRNCGAKARERRGGIREIFYGDILTSDMECLWTSFRVDFDIWVRGLVNFVFICLFRPLMQSKLVSTHTLSPNMSPAHHPLLNPLRNLRSEGFCGL